MKGFHFLPLLLLSVSVALISYGQMEAPVYELFKMPKVAAPSPDVAAIEKFGNFPVSYATGVPDISIPIWTIKCGPLSWPVSLSYHAGGVKVDESASSAGLGWSVNAIGSITRSRVGQKDEDVTNEKDYATVDDNDYVYLYSVRNGAGDSEMDVFNFSFNGKSGKFVIKQNGTIMQIPQSNLKITAATGLTSFTITDDGGITYLFDQREFSTVNFPGISATSDCNTWYLRRVDLPNKKDSIVFSFTGAGQTSEIYYEFTQLVGEKFVSSTPTPILATQPGTIVQSNSGSTVNVSKITGITFPNGSLAFNYDAAFRQDIGTGNSVSNKLSSISINEIWNGVTTELKEFTFYQSYFAYNPAGAVNSYLQRRLSLDSVAESGMTSEATPKKYKFQYNSTPLMPRQSFGKDMWGFNNGVTNNQSLIQSQTVTWNNGVHDITSNIGNANRNVDTAAMRGWMLTSITYPTGGKTDFVFEPHRYNSVAVNRQDFGSSASANGAQSPQVTTVMFTMPAGVVDTRLIVEMSKLTYGSPSQPSVVSLKDLTTGVSVYVLSQPTPSQNYAIDIPFNYVGNHQYELKATTYATVSSPDLTALIKAKWSTQSAQGVIKYGGGFRIKEMIHYTNATTIATKDVFVYDTAVTLTPFYFVERTYNDVVFRFNIVNSLGQCTAYGSSLCRSYQAGSTYPLALAMGSPMMYRRVQKINVNAATGAVNGKSEYEYDVNQEETYPVSGFFTPLPIVSNEWKNGCLGSETHYKFDGTNYIVIKKIANFYRLYNLDNALSLRVLSKVVNEGACTGNLSPVSVMNDITYYTFPTTTGSQRLDKSVETNYDDNQQVLTVTTTHYYNSDKYDYPTATVTVDSKNNLDSVVTKRAPEFFAAGNVYDKMEQKNMLAEVVEQKSYTQGVLLNTIKSNYKDWNGDQKVISPDTVQASLMSNPLETRLKYYAYDTYDNPVSVGKANDVVMTYIYAYNSKLPIAEATNTTSTHIAYTSFETDEKGGWTGTFGAGRVLSGSLTGRLAWTQNSFNFSKTGLSTSTTYTVSYWSKNGAYAVNSTTAVTGRVVNGWTHYSHKVVNPAGGTITVTGSGSIDELRLYPAVNVQMTTYTYRPQLGITSKCDANSRINYYEYDELQRLILIRDQDRNIIKKFAYNYNGQSEYPNIYYNTAQSVARYRQGCTGCQIGSLVTYTVPAETYLSTSSLNAANIIALADANANAQVYANAMGTCTAPSSATVPADNNVTNAGFSVRFHNNCTNVNYTYSLGPNYNTASLSPAPPNGNYDVTFTKMTGPGTYTYWIQGQSRSTSTDPVFTNIEVYLTGNQGVIIN